MLSIIIADDEEEVIDLCKMLIEYPGVAVIGEARNGLELLDKIEELHPDAVITDINMPGMTGLELIETAREEFPSVNFIVISGYTDFEYVQTALRFGVWDYLLKPIQKKELNGILEKLDHHLMQEKEASEQKEILDLDLRKSRSVLREQYIRQLRQALKTGTVLREDSMLVPEGFFQIGNEEKTACVEIHADSRMHTAKALNASLMEKAEDIFLQIQKNAQDSGWDVVTIKDNGTYLMVLVIPEGSAHTYDAFLKKAEAQIRQFNNQSRFIHLTGGSSLCVSAADEALSAVIMQAGFAIACRPEKWEEALIRYVEKDYLAVQEIPRYSMAEQLRSSIADQNEERACEMVKAAFECPDQAIPGSSLRLLSELLDYINQAFRLLPNAHNLPRELRIDSSDVLFEELNPSCIREHLCQCIHAAFSEYRDFTETQENNLIQKAKKYVALHYAEEISLEDVARHVVLNPSYFSSFFKAETGTGFIKYLQYVRMEQAKKLLRESHLRIEDIARKVGYRDLKYFNIIFRNETGAAPSEYRKLYS